MNKFLENFDEKIRALMNSEQLKKYNFPKSIHEIPNCPFKTFEELIENIKNKNAIVIQGFERSDTAFSLIATQWENILNYIGLITPYVVTLLVIILSFFLHNYWLLLAVTFPFIAAFFTSPQSPIKIIIPSIAFLLLSIGGFQKSMSLVFFFGGYFLCHTFLKLHRNIYSSTLFKRAFALESVFIFLHTSSYIELLDKDYEEFKTV